MLKEKRMRKCQKNYVEDENGSEILIHATTQLQFKQVGIIVATTFDFMRYISFGDTAMPRHRDDPDDFKTNLMTHKQYLRCVISVMFVSLIKCHPT